MSIPISRRGRRRRMARGTVRPERARSLWWVIALVAIGLTGCGASPTSDAALSRSAASDAAGSEVLHENRPHACFGTLVLATRIGETEAHLTFPGPDGAPGGLTVHVGQSFVIADETVDVLAMQPNTDESGDPGALNGYVVLRARPRASGAPAQS